MPNELEIVKIYTWEDVVVVYPGKWVRLSDCNLTAGSGIIDGILVGVYTDDESEKVELEMWDEESKDKLRRTTIGFGVGVIECLNARMEVKDEP